jgi:hypothetical protein
MKINELITGFDIWTTNEEKALLQKLDKPTPVSSLSEYEQFKIEAMVRKSLLTKIGHTNPLVVANEKNKTI